VTLYRGHALNRTVFLHKTLLYPFEGPFVSKLVETYARVINKEPSFTINPDFLSMIHEYIINKKTTYELPEIVNVMRYLPAYEFEEHKEITQNLVQKIK
jgi:hypothetical protein